MTLGQVQMVVLGFPGNRFTGEIRPRILELVDAGIVTIIDALFITKDAAGEVEAFEIAELVDDPEILELGELIRESLELISDEDAEALAADLEPESSALVLVFEHTWIRPVRDAVAASGGVVLADVMVPGPVVSEILEALDELEDESA